MSGRVTTGFTQQTGNCQQMTLRIDPQLTGQVLPDRGRDTTESSRSGVLLGNEVVVKDAVSILDDAKEEMAFVIGEKLEGKAHEERQVKPGHSPRPMKIDQINAYLDKARRQQDAQMLAQVARQLLQNAGQDVYRLSRFGEGFKNPMQQYLLLQMAKQMGLAEGAPASVLDRIDEALGDLYARFEVQIAANLETIDQASAYADTAADVNRFQGSIHKVLGHPTLNEALRQVMDLAGQSGQKLERALGNMMEALGACLASTTAFTDKVLLETLVSDLYQLKSLKTIFEGCKSMLRTLRRRASPSTPGEDDDPQEEPEPGDSTPPLPDTGAPAPRTR